MHNRDQEPDRAILIGLDFGQMGFLESLEELGLLAVSAGIVPRAYISGKRARPDPALFAGSGKVEEIRVAAEREGANLAIFNHELSPAQERNLEKALGVRVVDRASLIIDIFAQRAKSHVGKLQVELAQLERASTRLIRGWTHLERQRGGTGFLGGMGETQLEIDRRLIGRRVKVVKDELIRIKKQRDVQRRSRMRSGVLSVSLVGYTNAGKSTLFNKLTHAGSYAADQLFATLDTTTRRLYMEGIGQLVISDTVGFIRELPHTLIEAFRATLEETVHADVLLHVVDSSSAVREDQVDEVNKVLQEIGAGELPQILVWNKIDKSDARAGFDRDEYGKISRVRLSAQTGAGIEVLRLALTEFAAAKAAIRDLQGVGGAQGSSIGY
jgi:GTP-binding protein HflX